METSILFECSPIYGNLHISGHFGGTKSPWLVALTPKASMRSMPPDASGAWVCWCATRSTSQPWTMQGWPRREVGIFASAWAGRGMGDWTSIEAMGNQQKCPGGFWSWFKCFFSPRELGMLSKKHGDWRNKTGDDECWGSLNRWKLPLARVRSHMLEGDTLYIYIHVFIKYVQCFWTPQFPLHHGMPWMPSFHALVTSGH